MQKRQKEINVIIEKTVTGFSAYSDQYPIFTTGSTIAELMNNVYEACSLFFEEHQLNCLPENVHFEIDFRQFFKFYKVINSKFLAARIGMNPTLLSQYVNGRKKPSAKQTKKILEGIHQIGNELSELNLIYSSHR